MGAQWSSFTSCQGFLYPHKKKLSISTDTNQHHDYKQQLLNTTAETTICNLEWSIDSFKITKQEDNPPPNLLPEL